MEETYKKNPDGTVEITVTPPVVVNVVKQDDLIQNLKGVLKNAKVNVDIKQEELAEAKAELAKIKAQIAELTKIGVVVPE